MYHFVENVKGLDEAKDYARSIAFAIEKEVRDMGISCQIALIGSAKRNLITANGNEPFDFDYNLNVYHYDEFNEKELKDAVMNAANRVIWRNCLFGGVEDSTSSIRIKPIDLFHDGMCVFSIDIGIVAVNNDGLWMRLIHEKPHNFIDTHKYYWNIVPNSKRIYEELNYLKDKRKWQDVKNRYLIIKNRYLKLNNHEHPSFVCFAEAVHEIYQKESGAKR